MRRAFVWVVAALLVSAGVASGQTPRAGGTLTVAAGADMKVLDPHTTTLGAFADRLRFTVFDSLVEVDPEGKFIPHLASSWTFADPKTVVVSLRRGVKFHDGADFTADDVIFTVERVRDPKLGSQWAPQVAGIASVAALDRYKVKFNLKEPTPSEVFLSNLLLLQIVGRTSASNLRTHPVGTGPFQFVEWIPNDRTVVKKFPGYWRKGRPYLDQIIFRATPDAQARIASLQAGNVDMALRISPRDAERLGTDKRLRVVASPPTSAYYAVQINTQQSPMNNKRLRKAISFAMDREGYVKGVLRGHGRVAFSPFASVNWGYNPKMGEYARMDLDRARKLLAEAGYPDGKGLSLEILTPAGWPELMQGAVILQSGLKKLGVETSIRELESAAWIDRIATKPDYQLNMVPYWYGGAHEPSVAFNTDNLNPKTNIPRFRHERYAELVTKGATTVDREARKKIYIELQDILADEVPMFLIAHVSQMSMTRAATHGWNPGALTRWLYTNVWKEQ